MKNRDDATQESAEQQESHVGNGQEPTPEVVEDFQQNRAEVVGDAQPESRLPIDVVQENQEQAEREGRE